MQISELSKTDYFGAVASHGGSTCVVIVYIISAEYFHQGLLYNIHVIIFD